MFAIRPRRRAGWFSGAVPSYALLSLVPLLIAPCLGGAARAAADWLSAEKAFAAALAVPGYGDDAKAIDGMARAVGLTLDCGDGVTLELARIPAGAFMMGSPELEANRLDDEIQHRVTLTRAFFLGRYEVTQAQYRAVMGENPSKFRGDGNPVERVSWAEAVEFCRRLSSKTGREVRLPTEAEWEYACRSGTTTAYSSGDDPETLARVGNVADAEAKAALKWVLKRELLDEMTLSASDGYGVTTAPVGSFRPNAWGLYDMHGNVWEWCSDWYGPYDARNGIDPRGASDGTYRVVRGGSWIDGPRNCRSAYRVRFEPGSRYNNLGFRVALD